MRFNPNPSNLIKINKPAFTPEEVKEFFNSIDSIKEEGAPTPSSEERLAALEQAIADLALLFTINN